jgi:hypothetical protein
MLSLPIIHGNPDHGRQVSSYRRDVLTRLPTAPAGSLGDLLPDRWQAARAASAGARP